MDEVLLQRQDRQDSQALVLKMKLKGLLQRIHFKVGTTLVATLVDDSGPLGISVYDVKCRNKQGTVVERVVFDANRGFIIARLPQRTVEELNALLRFDLFRFQPAKA
jgi:hypothetical protein